MTDTLFSLQGMRYFSTIDLIKGYYQIEMDTSSIKKTTPFSHWEFLRMPFGVKNGPATFQRATIGPKPHSMESGNDLPR